MAIQQYYRRRPLRFIYIIYWFLLAYIIAALVFWFISLTRQNDLIAKYKMELLLNDQLHPAREITKIKEDHHRRVIQYMGEGATFLILIVAGAILVFRMVRRQLKLSAQQQDFMMAITHELKTPIAVTKLNLETLLKRRLDASQQNRLIAGSLRETDRLNTLCNNMILLSQMDMGGYQMNKEIINLADISLESVEDFKKRHTERMIETKIEFHPQIFGDRVMIQLAINNLLDNAVKYSPKNSTILLSVCKEESHPAIKVADQGKGVPELEKARIFDKYFRGENTKTKGTGLGLYVSNKIIHANNGFIRLKDNRPQGSIFAIIFKDKL